MYINSHNVSESYVIAYMWWDLAQANGAERAAKNKTYTE